MSPGMPEMILEITMPLEMAEKRRDPHVCETGDDHNDRQKPLQPQWTQGERCEPHAHPTRVLLHSSCCTGLWFAGRPYRQAYCLGQTPTSLQLSNLYVCLDVVFGSTSPDPKPVVCLYAEV